MWQDVKEISWSQRRPLGTTTGRASRTKGQKQIKAVQGEMFKDVQPVVIDGDYPTKEYLRGLDWNRAVYFKPTKTNYAGFDMFVLRKKGKRWVMYAIQVTVKKAADHGVDAFDDVYLDGWQKLLHINLDWELYVLTPENDPSPVRPSSVSDRIPIFQVGFGDLVETCDRSCGIKVVKDFVEFLEQKRLPKKLKR